MTAAGTFHSPPVGSLAIAVTLIVVSASAAVAAAFFGRRRHACMRSRMENLEASLAIALEKCAAERRGRVRAQQMLRNALVEQGSDKSRQSALLSYPMLPIGTVRSCFSTRNGTPRQPLLVPQARACLNLDPSRVPGEALEGLSCYSHCWVIYVFHLNTDLDKVWRQPSRSKLKAKVRVPRLKGEKMGVFATRSPHRPCPIGLSVAKVEAINGHAVLLSGVDMVNGTPVLDIKPYVPYSDKIQEATLPDWLQADRELVVQSISFSSDFASSLACCWATVGSRSLYGSADEFQSLVHEVLMWDIRSISQRKRPHRVVMDVIDIKNDNEMEEEHTREMVDKNDLPDEVVYHLILEGIDISYQIDKQSNIVVQNAAVVSAVG